MAKRRSKPKKSDLLQAAAAKLLPRGKHCGWCMWVWALVLKKEKVVWDWKLLLENWTHHCKCKPPRQKGRHAYQIVKKGCVKSHIMPKACADFDCLWECHYVDGMWRWVKDPGNDNCPDGCACPEPGWRPGPMEPPTYMPCEGVHA